MKHCVRRLAERENRPTAQRAGSAASRGFRVAGRFAALLLASLLVLQVSACVSASKFREVVAERDAFSEESSQVGELAGQLEVSNAALEMERVRIYDELENMRVENEALALRRSALEEDVRRLSEIEGNLSQELEATSLALSAASDQVRDLQNTYQGLVNDLETELQKGEIEIEQLRSGLRVAVSDEILFASGSVMLDPGGVDLLEKLAANLSKLDYEIDVEGHTDNLAIRGVLKQRYPSNWELAGARASSVVRLFEAKGIEGARLKAISRASHEPVASNDEEEGRSMNRRIEILLRPRESSDLIAAPVDRRAADRKEDSSSPSEDTPTRATPPSDES